MRTPLKTAISTVAVLASALAAAGCGSSTATNTSPSSINRCGVSLNGGGTVPAQGGSATISVAAARECSWSATTEGAWLSIRSGATGQGDGSVVVTAVANPDPVVRRGAVVLNEQRHAVVQAAGECSIALAENEETFPRSGGSGRVEVRASSTLCSWTAVSDSEWIHIRSGASGTGTGDVPFDVMGTTGPTRSGAITVAGQRYEITQSEGCAYSITPDSQTVPAGGGGGSIAVRTAAACSWTAASNVSWLTLSVREGSGPGTVSFSATPTTNARTGTAVIAGRTFTVTQSAAPGPSPEPAPACAYAVQPRAHSIGAGGGTFSVSVATTAGCGWTAASNASWITLNSTASSSGAGSASFAVSSTSSSGRTGTVTVAGETVTVTQGEGCSFAIAPNGASVPADGDEGRVTVTAGAGCRWTAASNASWIQLSSGTSGSGNGEVEFVAAANSGDARSGTITIAGQTFTVSQERAPQSCRYRVRPEEIEDVPSRGAFVEVDVSTSRECEWTAVSEADWIHIVRNARGSGDGEVILGISRNEGKKREGTVRIAGERVTVEQEEEDDDDDRGGGDDRL